MGWDPACHVVVPRAERRHVDEGVFGDLDILGAVDLVASEGWRLLPLYRLDVSSGIWWHLNGSGEAPLSLRDVRYEHGATAYSAHRHREPESRLADYLAEARALLADPPAPSRAPMAVEQGADFESLRWFWLPEEIAAAQSG